MFMYFWIPCISIPQSPIIWVWIVKIRTDDVSATCSWIACFHSLSSRYFCMLLDHELQIMFVCKDASRVSRTDDELETAVQGSCVSRWWTWLCRTIVCQVHSYYYDVVSRSFQCQQIRMIWFDLRQIVIWELSIRVVHFY